MTADPGASVAVCPPDQFRARDLADRGAQEEHGAGQMFGGVDLAIHVQNFLRARDAHVVDELLAVVTEAGAVAGAGEFRHPGAARAAVEVEAELRTEAAQGGEFGSVDLG